MNEKELAVVKTATEFLEVQKNLTAPEQKQFVELCKAFELNPFKREIYAIAYGEGQKRKCSIVIGYEVFLKRAYATGLVDGWKVYTQGSVEDKTLKAVIEIKRKGWDQPFIHEVFYSEYVGYVVRDGQKVVNTMWEGKPITMIKKVAIGQGFRLCFPEELSGVPYLEEEVQQEIKGKDEAIEVNPYMPEETATVQVSKNETVTGVKVKNPKIGSMFEEISKIDAELDSIKDPLEGK